MDWMEFLQQLSPALCSMLLSLISLVTCLIRTRHKKLHQDTSTEHVVKSSSLSEYYVLDKDGNEINLGSVTIHKKS